MGTGTRETQGDGVDVGLTTLTSRVLFGGARQLARPDEVARRLAEAISVGLILDGEQLPSEARLADEVGTGLSTLRQALAILRAQGLVETRRGRGGGTFVRIAADVGGVPGGEEGLPHAGLLRRRLLGMSVHELAELGDHRRAVSGTAAALAAERSVPGELDTLRLQVDRLTRARAASGRRRADTQLAMEIAAVGQSAVLVEREVALRAELGDLLWWRADDAWLEHVVAMRRTTVAAIEDGDADEARRTCETLVAQETRRLVADRLEAYAQEGT